MPPSFAELIVGNIETTVPELLNRALNTAPLGFVSIDVDYYSSAKGASAFFQGVPTAYLPTVTAYLDDIDNYDVSP